MIFLFIILFFNQEVRAQVYPLTPFTSIRFNSSAKVYLTKGDSYSIEFKQDTTVNSPPEWNIFAGTLEINSAHRSPITDSSYTTTEIKITVVDPLEVFEFNGNGMMEFRNSGFKKFLFLLNGSAGVYAELNGEKAEIIINGTGNFTLKGNIDDLILKINGTGDMYARKLSARLADLAIIGTGEIFLTVTENLNSLISGSGNINYYGSPIVKHTLTGYGTLNKRMDVKF